MKSTMGLYLMLSRIVPSQLYLYLTEFNIIGSYYCESNRNKNSIGFEKQNHFAENDACSCSKIRVRVSERASDSVNLNGNRLRLKSK
jgi:hypothetical protein